MRKLITLIILTLAGWSYTTAQNTQTVDEPSFFERITKLENKNKAFNLYLNMQGSFNGYMGNVGFKRETEAAFRMKQLRIEAMGDITDKIFYRYRQRLNRSNSAQQLDNLPYSIDYAAVGYRITPEFYMFAGRQCTAFGGFEFDLNPIEIYEYSDIIEYMTNFLTGVEFGYTFAENQQIKFQIVDGQASNFAGMYEEFNGAMTALPDNIKPAKAPLGYTLNWNGGFWDNMLQTRWSASIFHQSTKKDWYYYALGTQLNLNKWNMFFDFQWSNEGIDRTGIITEMLLADGINARALNTRYLSLVFKCNYRFLPKFNAFIKGMYETANLKDNVTVTDGVSEIPLESGKYRTSWGYIGGIEYYPMESNLHFFLTYIGRSYDYTEKVNFINTNPQRIELGLIYKIPLF